MNTVGYVPDANEYMTCGELNANHNLIKQQINAYGLRLSTSRYLAPMERTAIMQQINRLQNQRQVYEGYIANCSESFEPAVTDTINDQASNDYQEPLPATTTTQQPGAAQKNYTPYLILGAVGLYFLTRKKKGK